jgi:hypothetical protein
VLGSLYVIPVLAIVAGILWINRPKRNAEPVVSIAPAPAAA